MSLLVNKDIIINIISAIKLGDGGAAILAAHIINHIMANVGKVIFKPLLTTSLRELDML